MLYQLGPEVDHSILGWLADHNQLVEERNLVVVRMDLVVRRMVGLELAFRRLVVEVED